MSESMCWISANVCWAIGRFWNSWEFQVWSWNYIGFNEYVFEIPKNDIGRCIWECRKIPIISPGLIFDQKAVLLGLFLGELIFGGAYYWKEFCVSKWVALDTKAASTKSPLTYIWEGLLSEGYLRLRFGGLIFARAYLFIYLFIYYLFIYLFIFFVFFFLGGGALIIGILRYLIIWLAARGQDEANPLPCLATRAISSARDCPFIARYYSQ